LSAVNGFVDGGADGLKMDVFGKVGICNVCAELQFPRAGEETIEKAGEDDDGVCEGGRCMERSRMSI